MGVDIFNPEVSEVVKGLEGKLVLIYGTNSTGKTKNMVKANKPLVCCFENGLNALGGIKNIKIKKWVDWTSFVKQLTGASTINQAKEMYSTIIIDTVDGMANLASDFVCGNFGIDTIGQGNRGYGVWKEYSAEIEKWLKLLTNSGYTIVFLGHEGERTFQDDKGKDYTKIYPFGDKRVIDPVCNLCDIIGYAQVQPDNDKGQEVLSKLYLKGSPAFHARSRFVYMAPCIDEWNLDKLEKALAEAIVAEEKESGVKATTLDKAQKKQAEEVRKEEKNKQTITELIEIIGDKLQTMNEKEGNLTSYKEILSSELGNSDFKAQEATEQQRDQLGLILTALAAKGY
jgi:phage nucleotide-binding protein